MRLLISSFVLLAIVPATSNAQTALSQPLPVSAQRPVPELSSQTTSGPTIESAAVGIRPQAVSTADASAEAQARRRTGVNQNVALMIVGGGAMIAGAIIGGDAGTIFLVGGAIVGLWGLYQYLR